MKEVLIIDDLEISRKALELLVRQVDENAVIYMAENERDAYLIAMKKTIDLFLIDIVLHPGKAGGDQSGAEFAQDMRRVKKYQFTPIVFITSLYDPKCSMYRVVRCYNFIEKPYNPERVKKIIKSAIQYQTKDSKDRSIFFRVDGILEAVTVEEIIFAFSRWQHLNVVTRTEKLIIPYKSCSSLQADLDSESFIRCNRSTIVNLEYIKCVDSVNRYIFLKENETVLEIGPIIKKSFMKKLKNKIYLTLI